MSDIQLVKNPDGSSSWVPVNGKETPVQNGDKTTNIQNIQSPHVRPN